MGHHVLKDLLSTIREAVRFAIIVDEATDISHKEQLCIAIRSLDQKVDVHEDAVEFINIPMTCRNSNYVNQRHSHSVLSPLESVPWSGIWWCISGHVSDVAAQIQEYAPKALYVHCLAHCLNLCLQTVWRKLPPVRDALDLTMEVNSYVSHPSSPLFLSLYECNLLQEHLHLNPMSNSMDGMYQSIRCKK